MEQHTTSEGFQCACGSEHFRLTREITVIQTLDIWLLDHRGTYDVVDDDLHDTVNEGAFEGAECLECGTSVALSDLFPCGIPTLKA